MPRGSKCTHPSNTNIVNTVLPVQLDSRDSLLTTNNCQTLDSTKTYDDSNMLYYTTVDTMPPSVLNRNSKGVDTNVHGKPVLPSWLEATNWLDNNHEFVKLNEQVKTLGYPNVYGAQIPVESAWNLARLEILLQDYADRQVVEFLRYGWPANRLPSMPALTQNSRNHNSAILFPNFIRNYINKQLRLNHIVGPFQVSPFARTGISPLSTRPKKEVGSRRTILDLSFPEMASVNDHTPKDSYLGLKIDLVYPTVNDLARRISELGQGAHIYRKDLLGAFLQIPWDPADAELFGCVWDNMIFFFRMLVMGHRISPYICQCKTDCITFIHWKNGYFLLNYIDDFVGAEHPDKALEAYTQLGELLEDIGAAESPDKSVPPSPVCDFLGVLFNSITGTMEVEPERLCEIRQEVSTMQHMTTISRKGLERIIGKLQFVAACVRPGRVFISRLLNTLRGLQPGEVAPMDSQTKKDLNWWEIFLPHYNGVSIMWPRQLLTPDAVIACDACPVGAGGILWGSEYYRLTFPAEWRDKNIAYLEMLAIIICLKVWGDKLAGCKVVINSDNESCCYMINNGKSKDLFLQAALREVSFLLATHQVELKLNHVKGTQNSIPDWLSRWPRGGEVRRKFRDYAHGERLIRVRTPLTLLKFTHNWLPAFFSRYGGQTGSPGSQTRKINSARVRENEWQRPSYSY